DVADVARVVVAGDDHKRLALDLVQVGLRLRVLGLEAESGQVAGADDEVRLHVVDLADRPLEQRRHEVRPSAVQIGDVSDREGAVLTGRHGPKSTGVSTGETAGSATGYPPLSSAPVGGSIERIVPDALTRADLQWQRPCSHLVPKDAEGR